MVVFVLEAVPTSVRGEMTRWMLEPHPGVFVGRVSAGVRERLWKRVCKSLRTGNAMIIHTTNTEQGYEIRTWGPTRRLIVEFDGLMLAQMPRQPKAT